MSPWYERPDDEPHWHTDPDLPNPLSEGRLASNLIWVAIAIATIAFVWWMR